MLALELPAGMTICWLFDSWTVTSVCATLVSWAV